MAIVKLVCQGCGANLDALDNQRVIQCGYCGTSNQIKQTVYERPVPQPQPQQQPPPSVYQPPVQVSLPVAKPRRGIITFVVITTMLPLVIGGIVAVMAVRATSDAINQVPAFAGADPGTTGRKYRWDSAMPFVADVDQDGTDDIIGLVQDLGAQDVRLTAISGVGWTTLWQTSLGNRADIPGQVQVRFEAKNQLVLCAVGASLTAYDAKTGSQRWVSNFSDAVEAISVDGEQLRVSTIDEQIVGISPVDGKPTSDKGEPSANAMILRDDEGYELIPQTRTLDVDYDQFSELRVEAGFCPPQQLSQAGGRHGEWTCSFPHGLAWASRAQGTQVPFLLGYDRASKAERWRQQLTTPGTLETIDTGFSQPRAEMFGDDAVISFVPQDDNTRIRRISLTDGSTKWEAKIAPKPAGWVTGMTLGKQRVFVNYGGEVYVYELAGGELVAVLGDW